MILARFDRIEEEIRVLQTENANKKEEINQIQIENKMKIEEIDVLKERVCSQEKQLYNSQMKMEENEKKVTRLMKQLFTKKQQNHQFISQSSLRSTRSIKNIEFNDNSSSSVDGGISSWSNLQIAPGYIFSVPYKEYSLKIYEHYNNNNPKTNSTLKKYFYTPLSLLDHLSASSELNVFTKKTELRFRVAMWNNQLQNEIVRSLIDYLKVSIRSDQVSVLPIEKILLNGIRSTVVEQSMEWKSYHGHRDVYFKLICKQLDECNQLAEEMKMRPHQFDDMKLHLSLPSQSNEKRETTIQIGNAADGKKAAQLLQRFPNSQDIYLTSEDKNELLAEMSTAIIIRTYDDSTTVLTSRDDESYITKQLTKLLDISQDFLKSQQDIMWNSVFWNEDNYRPDKIERELNEKFNKLDTEKREKWAKELDSSMKVEGGFEASLLKFIRANFHASIDGSVSRAESKDGVEKFYIESKETIMWNGAKFSPKQLSLYRMNLMKLRNKQDFQDDYVRVRYTTSFLTLPVNIHNFLDENSTDLIFELQSKINSVDRYLEEQHFEFQSVQSQIYSNDEYILTCFQPIMNNLSIFIFHKDLTKRPDCYFEGKMPSTCRDLQCFGHKLSGFYLVKDVKKHKIETIYCDFAANNPQSASSISPLFGH